MSIGSQYRMNGLTLDNSPIEVYRTSTSPKFPFFINSKIKYNGNTSAYNIPYIVTNNKKYIWENGYTISNKFRLNGNDTYLMSRKGYRPFLQYTSGYGFLTANQTRYIHRADNGSLYYGSSESANDSKITFSGNGLTNDYPAQFFYLWIQAGGGGGAGRSFWGSGVGSGGGGGSGAYAIICFDMSSTGSQIRINTDGNTGKGGRGQHFFGGYEDAGKGTGVTVYYKKYSYYSYTKVITLGGGNAGTKGDFKSGSGGTVDQTASNSSYFYIVESGSGMQGGVYSGAPEEHPTNGQDFTRTFTRYYDENLSISVNYKGGTTTSTGIAITGDGGGGAASSQNGGGEAGTPSRKGQNGAYGSGGGGGYSQGGWNHLAEHDGGTGGQPTYYIAY